MSGNGGVYIKRLIEDGALKEDFKTELLGIYPKKECLARETGLAKTSLFPKGLNGNAGIAVVFTDEVRKKISDANTGKPLSTERKRKISEALRGDNNPNFGKKRSNEHCMRLSEALRGDNNPNFGKKRTEETKQKISKAKQGKPAHNKGKTRSEETKKKISKASLNRRKETCPYCGITCAVNVYSRCHGNKCKLNPNKGNL